MGEKISRRNAGMGLRREERMIIFCTAGLGKLVGECCTNLGSVGIPAQWRSADQSRNFISPE